MNVSDLLFDLRGAGIEVRVSGERLRVSAPAGALTEERRKLLAEHKPSIIEFLSRSSVLRGETEQALVRADRSARDFPVAPAQERLWFLEQLTPNTPVHNLAVAVRLDGRLNSLALGQALQALVQRHAALRTNFSEVAGEPRQVVHPALSVVIPIVDLSALPAALAEHELERISTAEGQNPFDLSHGPLVRGRVLLLREKSVVLLSVHHIVADGWSLEVMVRELAALYDAYSNAKTPTLAPPSVEYVDYAVSQRMWLQQPRLKEQLHFWREQLKGAQTLALPTDRPRPVMPTHRGERVRFQFDAELREFVAGVAQRCRTSAFVVALAAFMMQLARYARQSDICVGTMLAGRDRMELEGLIGFFVRTVVLRSSVLAHETFIELVERVREGALSADANQEVPFEHVVRELVRERDPSRQPLFQVAFGLRQQALGDTIDARWQIVPVETGVAHYDLGLFMREVKGVLEGELEYSADLLDRETAERIVAHYLRLLRDVTARSENHVGSFTLTSPEEREAILMRNRVPAAATEHRCLHEIFEDRVAVSPDAVAAVLGERQLTYAALNRAANRLAHHLRKRGVGPEVIVALALERSLDMVIAILAVLKAGGAYLPLDPLQPKARNEQILQDAGARHLIVGSGVSGLPPEAISCRIDLARDRDQIELHTASNPVSVSRSGDAAYIIYTSGSTGRPNGVVVSHANASRLFTTTHPTFQFAAKDVWSLVHSYAFDFSVWEIFGALLHGGRLVVVPYWVTRSPDDLLQLISEQCVTILSQTPSAFLQLMPSDDRVGRRHVLRRIVFGGEKLSMDALAPWVARHGLSAPVLVNMYGITEITVHASYREVGAPDVLSSHTSPIGCALGDLGLLLLDEQMRPAAVGVPGEIYVAGAGLARGYLGRPRLTAWRYVPNPFASEPGARLYRSGDIARLRTLDDIDYLGRDDHQIQLHGFRVELGEIESALRSFDGVTDACVVTRQRGGGSLGIVAYVASKNPEQVDRSALRAHLTTRLPGYMTPAAIVSLSRLPLTVNGKVDHSALPEADQGWAGSNSEYVPPHTSPEKTLAEIWAKVLQVGRVSLDDSFFELGGDSILAMQVVHQARDAGLAITVRQCFEHQTLRQLAHVAESAANLTPSAEPQEHVGELPLSTLQQWFLESNPVDVDQFSQALIIRSSGRLEPAALERALTDVVQHHDALGLRFDLERKTWTRDAASAALELHVVNVRPGAEPNFDEIVVEQARALQTSLSLSDGRLVGASLVRNPDRDAIAIAIHHFVVDGVSWRIVLQDLERAYLARRAGRAPDLPTNTSSWGSWCLKLADHAASEHMQRQETFWLEAAEDCHSELPVDLEQLANSVASARHTQIRLDAAETTALVRTANGAYGTQTQELLLTAIALALQGWTRREEVVIELEGHGREPVFDGVDLSRTVGCFTCLYPIRLRCKSGDVGDWIKSVKETLRTVPDRGVGYGILRHFGPRPEVRAALARFRPTVLVNHFGRVEADVEIGGGSLSIDPIKETRPGHAERSHLLEITSAIRSGRLEIDIEYSSHRHRPETIARFAQELVDALRQLVVHCTEANGGHTPSEFPLAAISQRELDDLLGPGRTTTALYPLSPIQEGMLVHSVEARASTAYFEQVAIEISGALDPATLERAWNHLISRHDALRAEVLWSSRGPLLRIRSDIELSFERVDLTSATSSESEAIEEFLRQDRARGLDLHHAPLMRCSWVSLARGRALFVWSHHHILVDGWSVQVLTQELARTYTALRAGTAFDFAPSIPFERHLRWLRDRDSKAAEQFWRGYLAGASKPTRLAALNIEAKPDGDSFQSKTLFLSEDVSRLLRAQAREQRVTLATMMQGVWALVLARYTGDDTVSFGLVTSGRPADLPGMDRAVGCFINTIPLCVQIDWARTARDWLADLQEQVAAARQYEATPLTDTLRWRGGSAAEGPLFDTLLALENYPREDVFRAWRVPGEEIEVGRTYNFERTNFALTLSITPGTRVRINAGFCTDRFDPAYVETLLSHLEQLLGSLCARPTDNLRHLSMLDPAERELVLSDWSRSKQLPAGGMLFHHSIERQAQVRFDATAVVADDCAVSFGELNRRANRLARLLRARGVGPEAVVAAFVPRGIDSVTLFIAVQKAGGAFLPLDPAYPDAQIASMLEDAAPKILVTRGELASRVVGSGCELLALDSVARELQRRPDHDLRLAHLPSSLAYVIYTSGSTGRPKGVMVERRHLQQLVEGIRHVYFSSDASGERMLQAAPLSFDAWICELAALASGATLCTATDEARRSGSALARLIAERHVTAALLSPAALSVMPSEDVPALRTLIVGGAACSGLTRQAWARGRAFFNAYGPTEGTGIATTQRCEPEGPAPPIGRAFGDATAFVFDRWREPTGVWVPGELFIGGAGVSRGYLRRAAETARRFLPDPHAQQPGARLYRSGDLVFFRDDGAIQFVARIDEQMKVRGYRIEPAEVETVLASYPGVNGAAVVVRRVPHGDDALVAFLETDPGVDLPELRRFAQTRLPEHMVPNAFEVLVQLPLLPNGKLNRRALESLRFTGRTAPAQAIQPRNATEQVLAGIWSEHLGVDSVGVEDDFLELGGHSLIASRILLTIEELFGCHLSLLRFFDARTVAAMAEELFQLASEERVHAIAETVLAVVEDQQV